LLWAHQNELQKYNQCILAKAQENKRPPLMLLFHSIFQLQVNDLMGAQRIESKGWQQTNVFNFYRSWLHRLTSSVTYDHL
jgi:hypothetical protein